MVRVGLVILALGVGSSGFVAERADAQADSRKERECAVQGVLMGTIQQARLSGVRLGNLQAAVAEARPDLGEAVLATVPTLGGHVYGMKKRDLRKVDLGAATQAQCLANWDQIEAMRKNITN